MPNHGRRPPIATDLHGCVYRHAAARGVHMILNVAVQEHVVPRLKRSLGDDLRCMPGSPCELQR
jgi:hypothetical protein